MTALDVGIRRHLMVKRLALGLTQQQLAALLGTTQSAVSDMENNRFDLRLSTVNRWAAALGVWVVVSWEPLEDET